MRVSYAHTETCIGVEIQNDDAVKHNITLTSHSEWSVFLSFLNMWQSWTGFWLIPTALSWYRYGSGVLQKYRELLLCLEKQT